MVEQRRLASTEWVDIVNEDNEVIAHSPAGTDACATLTASCDVYRRSAMVLGKIWCSVVPKQKISPGMLDATAGGAWSKAGMSSY